MSEVSVLGCGRMGSALIEALADSGIQVTIWNRTREKAERLTGPRVSVADTVGDALAASPTTIVSISNYEDTMALLNGHDEHLRDNTLVQLSSGRPDEVQALSERVTAAGGAYVDGSIMADPDTVGTDDLLILYSGDPDTFEEIEQLVEAFGGTATFVGEEPRAAAVHEMALLVPWSTAMAGVSLGGLVCEREGISLDWYVETLRAGLPEVLEVEYDRIRDPNRPTGPSQIEDVRYPESVADVTTYLRELDIDSRTHEAIYDLTATGFEEVREPEL